jgi:hypothetical protein
MTELPIAEDRFGALQQRFYFANKSLRMPHNARNIRDKGKS